MKRQINLVELLEGSSHFLLGPRGTGKSYEIRQALADRAQVINLLDSRLFLLLQNRPYELETLVQMPWVVIDEVQRVPELLNEVHRLIEEKGLRFLLTGSSARKLKKSGINLLAGRAWQARMFPLSWREISNDSEFTLESYLKIGGLPSAYLQPGKAREYLYSYVDTYLKEEILSEALVRDVAKYSRFLEAAALSNGKVINFTKIANDAQVSPNTVREYYQILDDTLVGFQLPAWTQSKHRKAIQTAKFYLFDVGVVNSLLGIENLESGTDRYGYAFEHFIAMELRAFLSYSRTKKTMSFWRTKNGDEVDFIVDDKLALEVKATNKLQDSDLRGLKRLKEEAAQKSYVIVSQDKLERQVNGIECLHWQTFLEKLWQGAFVE